jgi:ribonuclease HII
VERSLVARGHSLVIGCDEVGRGPIAGPVVAGLVVWYPDTQSWPDGLYDSKAITEKKRPAVAEALREVFPHHALGVSSAREVDTLGISVALGNAVARGLLELAGRGIPVGKSVLLLDGTVDYVTKALPHPLPVVTRAKADRDCVSVAAASVLAKVFRDNQMVELATQYPDYGFEGHKGYGSKKHYEALRAHGLSPEHRASWIRGVG